MVGLGEANKGANDSQNKGSPPKPFGIHVSVMAVYVCSTQPLPPLLKGLAFTRLYLKKATCLRASRMDVTTLCTSDFPGPVPGSSTTVIKVVS